MFSLRGKTAVVTGGGRGIGAGIALALAEQGADVVIAGRTRGPLEETAEAVRAKGAGVRVVEADITSFEGIEGIVKMATEAFGYIDCWVNNAGSARWQDVGRLINLTEDQWDRVVDLNLKWNFFCAQAAARVMTRGGSIINISSRAGSGPSPRQGNYGAAKAGLDALTGTMAVEWGHLGIRANGLALGVVPVDRAPSSAAPERRAPQASDGMGASPLALTPIRRNGTPADVGALCAYLASDEASWITGVVIPVNGGNRIPGGLVQYLAWVNEKLDREGAAAS
ncbi:MAG: SDR family oxidoreductase [Caulobacteraceae bacterium]|nr:SDR family oxidoreductase [Caulobacteraceae bacterium]